MNNKAILGISLGAVFAISMIMSPAFAGIGDGFIYDAHLKDHAAGGDPAKNPAHYELIVNATGNYTQYAIDQTLAGENATGFGIINSTGYVWAFTSHVFDDCDETDCGNYEPHGHEGQLINATGLGSTGNCLDADAELMLPIKDLGEAKVTVADDESYSIIELDDIPADAQLNLEAEICDVNMVPDVANVTSFTIQIDEGSGALCVYAVQELDVVAGVDGPDHTTTDKPKNKHWPLKLGGFNNTEGAEDDFCPTVP